MAFPRTGRAKLRVLFREQLMDIVVEIPN